MKAIVVTDQVAGTAGMTLVERPEPPAAINDDVVPVHASGLTWDELTCRSTWTDRLGRDRTPVIPGQELAGVVTALGCQSARQRLPVSSHGLSKPALECELVIAAISGSTTPLEMRKIAQLVSKYEWKWAVAS